MARRYLPRKLRVGSLLASGTFRDRTLLVMLVEMPSASLLFEKLP